MTIDATTSCAASAQPLDTEKLARWLRANVIPFSGELEIEAFEGGQSNPTYRVTAGGHRFVLRRKPPGDLLPSAHAVDREYRVMSALAGRGVPVPKMIALCEDTAVIGTTFFLMEWVEGRVIWDPALPGIKPAARAAHYDELNRVIATLHGVDYEAAGMSDFGRHGQYVARQVARWSRQYAAAAGARIPAMDRLIEWLPANIPESDETTIVHGDFRIDNVVFHPTEPKILAVLDWELSTLGHPLSDFAYHMIAWRLTPAQFRGLKGHDLTALGIPTEEDYVALYCRRTGRREIRGWEVYLVFNMFRIAAILHGVRARALQGNAASANAAETGARAELVADAAWKTAQRLEQGAH